MQDKISIKKNMIYNTVGSVFYYACQWFMSVIIVRTSGYEAAGILSLAMSVTGSPALVALFNIRGYQVSDIQNQYSSTVYIQSRHVSNALAYFICFITVLVGGYNLKKTIVIMTFMILKIIEGYADVYYGIEQKYNRLDYCGISMTLRGIGIIVPFAAVLYIWNNIILSLVVVSVVNVIIFLLWDVRLYNRYMRDGVKETQKEIRQGVKSLLLTCYPLAIVAFLNALSINIPKLAFEKFYGSQAMGYYSSVASPTLVVQLAATTIFAPLVTPVTKAFVEKDKERFYGICRKFLLLFLGLTILVLAASKLLAHWGLVLLFGEGIEAYVWLFVPVILLSVLMAIQSVLYSVCTLVRAIKPQYWSVIAAMIVAVTGSFTVVKAYDMRGLVIGLGITQATNILVQLVIIARKLKKNWGLS